jgi:glycosyltransferase involved in cell wall biosynthesis
MPLVTVGLSCFNEEAFVAQAVKSILVQTFRDWELIAIDDGSHDGTAQVLRGIRDPRVRVVVDGRHSGLAARLNEVAALAAGKYVARMDADDAAHPERLERQIAYLESHPEVDVLGTGMAIVDRRGRVNGLRSMPEEPFANAREPLIAHATICCRKEWIRSHPYNERHPRSEDWVLWRTTGPVAGKNLPEPLYFYREFDSFRLGKYLGRQTSMMKSYARHGELARLARSVFHCGVYTAAAIAGMTDALVARRSTPLDVHQQSELQHAFDAILRTKLEDRQQAPAASDA